VSRAFHRLTVEVALVIHCDKGLQDLWSKFKIINKILRIVS